MTALLTGSVSPAAAAVPASGIREIVNLAQTVDNIIRLEIGEPDFPTPAHIVEAGYAAARSGNRYTHSAGVAALRAALGRRLSHRYGLTDDPERVVVTQGAVQGIAAVFAAMVVAGDEVLIPDPAWPNYEMQAALFGARAVHYTLAPELGFLPSVQEVISLITPRTRLLVINSPSNPTGVVFPAQLIEQLVEAAVDRGVTVISDEVYDDIIFDGSHTNAAGLAPEHVVSVFSFSKTYAMTGSRVGYLTGPGWLIPTVARLQEPLLSCISAASQAEALAALHGPQDFVREAVQAYRARRDVVVALLAAAGIQVTAPSGAFYLMVPLGRGVDARVAALDLVRHGVATAPGTAFGTVARSHLRLSLASSAEQLAAGVDRLAEWHHATGGGSSPWTG